MQTILDNIQTQVNQKHINLSRCNLNFLDLNEVKEVVSKLATCSNLQSLDLRYNCIGVMNADQIKALCTCLLYTSPSPRYS